MNHAPSPGRPNLSEAPNVTRTLPLSRYYGALAELHRRGVALSQLAVLFPLTEARIRQLLRRRGQRVRTQPGRLAARPAREMLVRTLARHGLTFDDLCGVRDVEDPWR